MYFANPLRLTLVAGILVAVWLWGMGLPMHTGPGHRLALFAGGSAVALVGELLVMWVMTIRWTNWREGTAIWVQLVFRRGITPRELWELMRRVDRRTEQRHAEEVVDRQAQVAAAEAAHQLQTARVLKRLKRFLGDHPEVEQMASAIARMPSAEAEELIAHLRTFTSLWEETRRLGPEVTARFTELFQLRAWDEARDLVQVAKRHQLLLREAEVVGIRDQVAEVLREGTETYAEELIREQRRVNIRLNELASLEERVRQLPQPVQGPLLEQLARAREVVSNLRDFERTVYPVRKATTKGA